MRKTRTSDWIRGHTLGLAALFFALTGGVAWGTHPGGQKTINSDDIINEEVKNADLAPDSVGSGKIIDGEVKGADIAAGAVGEAELARAAVTIPKLAFDPATQTELNAHKASGDHDGRYWTLAGNKGTVPGKQFLGTLDNVALEFRVNQARALRLEPASDGTNVSPNVIGGIVDNFVTAGAHSATIAGGGRLVAKDPATANRVTDNRGTVGGGANNQAGDGDGNPFGAPLATVGGGRSNTASGEEATVGGGRSNTADAPQATVGGGVNNAATGFESTVGGGAGNAADGFASTVPGGANNTALGPFSFAAGNRAKANHSGAFVWADSQAANMASTNTNQFIARAAGRFFLQGDSTLDDFGGFLNTSTGAFLSAGGAWTNASDERVKSRFEAVEPRDVLGRLAELPIRSWEYDSEPGVPHLGPTAQDFRRAFGLGADNRHIASVDADGVALAAIKGLDKEVASLQRKLRAEHRRRIELRHQTARLQRRLVTLEQHGR